MSATMPYAAAAAAPPTTNLLTAPHTYPSTLLLAALVILTLTALETSGTMSVKVHEYLSAMCAVGIKK